MRRRINYAQFDKSHDASPVFFTNFDQSLLRDLRSSGSLIARKFNSSGVNVNIWCQLVLGYPSDYVIKPDHHGKNRNSLDDSFTSVGSEGTNNSGKKRAREETVEDSLARPLKSSR